MKKILVSANNEKEERGDKVNAEMEGCAIKYTEHGYEICKRREFKQINNGSGVVVKSYGAVAF